MTTPAVARLASVSLDCTDPVVLAAFYSALLGMPQVFAAEDGHFIAISDGAMYVTFVRTGDHVPPTWPAAGQLQQMHLDLAVSELDAAVAVAVGLGARVADHQPNPDSWRVLLDPAGHPFCVTTLIPV
jgi:catechol 2,3-dioxygenase-like lactoylglutathione lyase family enzyme